MAVPHVCQVKTLADIRGIVAFAICTCGWRAENHPSIPTAAEAVTKATADMHKHLQSIPPEPDEPPRAA